MTLSSSKFQSRWATACCISLFLAGAFASPIAAQQNGKNLADEAPASGGPIAVLDAAIALADFGRAKSDPVVLLGAAAAINTIGQTPGKGEVSTAELPQGDKSDMVAATVMDKPEEGSAADRDLVAELVREARFFARGDEALLAQADTVEASATRESVTGPGRYHVRVGRSDMVVIRETFAGGRTAEVGIVGDGDTDLDLVVEDENGNVVCSGTGNRDREFCSWTPVWTGTFRIGVQNYGRVYNDAIVIVN